MVSIHPRLASSVVILAVALSQAVAKESPDALDFFESRIRPVLIEHCYECHSEQSKQPKGGLRLDSREAARTGGETGPAVVPHRVDESLLIDAIKYESYEMPPKGTLPEAVIADFVKWIEMGAPDPRDGNQKSQGDLGNGTQAASQDHWAFQPIVRPAVPELSNAGNRWATNDIDRFIVRKLREYSLLPSEDADRYTWLRRVSIDLTGLPPTPDEIEAFVANSSPRSHEAVVERLLASPAFGERWARHWLDLVGYADQIGTSNNVFAEHAWRYRDYVVETYNNDVPFDQFIREQIAGDLIAEQLPQVEAKQRAAAITATGFLVLHDVEIVEADKAKMRVDLVDQQVVKASRAFLGLTIGCARCHDHKFDPISQRDYYAMASFFYNTQSTYKTDRGVWSDVLYRDLPETKRQLAARERSLAEHQQQLDDWQHEKESLASEVASLEKQMAAAEDKQKKKLTAQRDAKRNRINVLRRQIMHGEFFSPKPPRAYGVHDHGAFEEMRITIRGNPHALSDEVPRGFPAVVANSRSPTFDAGSSGRLQLADWISSAENPLTSRVAVNRTWQKLFGEGLVSSVDYFGVRGSRPSHPELLDYLASEFVEHGWSVKSLIRSIVLSRTYRMASSHNEAAHAIDPNNQWLWRTNRRRLDAEALRDTLLAISGQLQTSQGGDPLSLEFVENVGNLDPKDVNPPSFSLRRYRPELTSQRSIYLPVVRSTAQPGPAELRNIFDFPTPAQMLGKRPVTAVPTQALFLMNSDQVKQWSQGLAKYATELTDDESDLIRNLWLLVLNRPPTAAEAKEATVLVNESSLEDLCHALIATNEFLMTL